MDEKSCLIDPATVPDFLRGSPRAVAERETTREETSQKKINSRFTSAITFVDRNANQSRIGSTSITPMSADVEGENFRGEIPYGRKRKPTLRRSCLCQESELLIRYVEPIGQTRCRPDKPKILFEARVSYREEMRAPFIQSRNYLRETDGVDLKSLRCSRFGKEERNDARQQTVKN